MNRAEIKNEIDKAMQHMPDCEKSKKGDSECTCYHKDASDYLYQLFIQILKGNR